MYLSLQVHVLKSWLYEMFGKWLAEWEWWQEIKKIRQNAK